MSNFEWIKQVPASEWRDDSRGDRKMYKLSLPEFLFRSGLESGARWKPAFKIWSSTTQDNRYFATGIDVNLGGDPPSVVIHFLT
ncbi:hypothetical protein [Xanthomonas campestris]|uniref:hypothetical protein n=1 Tax=Xanthomonas campestris TaxID=339 RepID=UPI0012907CB5|nr:hypothetical protein [Xanthomonas campestris]